MATTRPGNVLGSGDLGWLPQDDPPTDSTTAGDVPWLTYLDGDSPLQYTGEDAEQFADDIVTDTDYWISVEDQSTPVIPSLATYYGEDAELLAEDVVLDDDSWTLVEDQSKPVVADFIPPPQYFGEDAELLDQDDDDQVLLWPDPTDGLAAYYGEQAEQLDQDDDDQVLLWPDPTDSIATYYGEDAELLDQDDDDQVLLWPDPTDGVATYYGESSEQLDQDDDEQWCVDEAQIVIPPVVPSIVEDAWDHFPAEDDWYYVADDYPLLTAPVPLLLFGVAYCFVVASGIVGPVRLYKTLDPRRYNASVAWLGYRDASGRGIY